MNELIARALLRGLLVMAFPAATLAPPRGGRTTAAPLPAVLPPGAPLPARPDLNALPPLPTQDRPAARYHNRWKWCSAWSHTHCCE